MNTVTKWKSANDHLLSHLWRTITALLLLVLLAAVCLGLNKFAAYRLRDAFAVAQGLFAITFFVSILRWMFRR